MNDVAPALAQDQSIVPMLGEALELAEHLKPAWPWLSAEAHLAGLICEGEEGDEGGTDPVATPEGEEAPDTPAEGEESFTDFDLSELPDEVRTAAEGIKKQMQGDYTRKMQSLAEERRESERNAQVIQAMQNPQTQAAVLAQFGIDLQEEEEAGDEFGDEEPDIYDEVERLKHQLTEREEREEQARYEVAELDYISQEIDALEGAEEREFDQNEQRLLSEYARANRTPEGIPDVRGAFELLSGIYSTRQKAWEQDLTKGKSKTPRAPGRGKPGSKAVDSSKESREERLARLAQVADEARGSLAA